MPLPKAIQLEPTTKCNFSCVACTRKSLPKSRLNRDLTVQDFQHILEGIPTLKIIKMQGLGEPLINQHIWEILEYGKVRGIKFSTTTNGSLLNPVNIRKVLKYFDSICVSIDSTNPDTFEYIRRGAKYENIMRNLKSLIEIKREIRAKTEVGVNFVASHLNYHEISSLCSMASQLRLNFIYIVEVENWTTPGEKEYLSTLEFIRKARRVKAEIRRLILENRKKYRELPIYHGDSSRRKMKCSWCFSKCFITVDGYVTPCCIRMNQNVFNFGNIFNESFNNIWNGEKMRKFRLSMIKDELNPVCDRCPD
ncbi:SPASM domain-containing protein [Candidatus Bathyarchaeota archaeon]|nr:SPASM domain-containing protein [Candidatus Bathyarchaeota archaeon]